MDARADSYTKHLKAHDSALFCERPKVGGPFHVSRKGTRWETYAVDGGALRVSRPVKHFVLALTHNWSPSGTPVEWGIEPLMARIKEIDTHRRDVLASLMEEHERAEQSRKRSFRSETEAFFTDYRREFARATNHINTSTMEKVDSRRNHGNQ